MIEYPLSSPAPRPDPAQLDARRLRLLAELRLTGELTAEDRAPFDALCTLAAQSFHVPTCLLTLIDLANATVVAKHGQADTRLPREHTLCEIGVMGNAPLVVLDARQDPRFAAHLKVHCEGGVRFYAGVPVRADDGTPLGMLCLVDSQPRALFDAAALQTLERLGHLVSAALNNRRHQSALMAERALLAAGPMAAVLWSTAEGWPLLYQSANLAQVLGEDAARRLNEGAPFESVVHPDDRANWRNALRSHSVTPLASLEITMRIVSGGGQVRWVRQTSVVDTVDGHTPQRLRGYLSDETRQKRLEAGMTVTQERLFMALESARLGTWEAWLDSGRVQLSPRLAELLGTRPEGLPTRLDDCLQHVHPYDLAEVTAQFSRPSRPGQQFSLQCRLRQRDGQAVWVECFAKVLQVGNQQRPTHLVGTLRDVSQTRLAEHGRERQRQLLDLLNQAQGAFLISRSMQEACTNLFEPLLKLARSRFGFIGIVRHDAEGRMVLTLPAVSNLAWDAPTRAAYEAHHQGQPMEFTQLDNLFGHVVTHGEVVLANDPASHPAARGWPPGHPVLENFLGLPIRHYGMVVGMIGLGNRSEGFDGALMTLLEPLVSTLGVLIHARGMEDARRRAEDKLRRQATTDELTGLANRRHFYEAASEAVARAQRSGAALSLAVIDLDFFKRVNDSHGHAVGDEVLRRFAAVARAVMPDTDLVGRLGGEEFAVLLHDTDLPAAQASLNRLREAVAISRVPAGAAGGHLSVTLSAGVAAWQPGLNVDDWVARADAAVYAAKAHGRNQVCLAGVPETVGPETEEPVTEAPVADAPVAEAPVAAVPVAMVPADKA